MEITGSQFKAMPRVTYEKIRRDLIENNVPAGTKLVSIQELAKKYNVSYLTAQRAVKLLQKDGYLRSRRGDGTYVTEKITGSEPDTQKKNITKRVHSIGVIMPYWMDDSGALAFHRINRGFLSRLDGKKWRIEMINNEFHEAAKPDFVDKILQKGLDGIFWVAPQPEHQMNIMRLIDKGMLVVGSGRRFPDLPFVSTFADFPDMGKKIAEYCVKNKYTKIIVLCGILKGELKDANSANFVKNISEALKEKNIELPDENIGQAAIFTRDNSVLNALGRIFLEKHADAEVIISYHEEFFPIIEELDSKNFWQDPTSMIIIDVNAEFGFNRKQVGRIPVASISLPLENMGTAAAMEFEKKWLDKSDDRCPDLSVTLVPPSTT